MKELESISSFNQNHLPEPENRYVAWVDIMGTKNMMVNSSYIAAINICKLYLYVTNAPRYAEVNVYPMGDGAFIVAKKLEHIQTFLEDVFSQLAGEQIRSYKNGDLNIRNVSIIKAAITAGKVREGENFTETVLQYHEIKDQLLFGKPIAQANKFEREAPPFGIYQHESASEKGKSSTLEWWDDTDLNRLTMGMLNDYFDYFSENPEYDYPKKRIEDHRNNAQNYLA